MNWLTQTETFLPRFKKLTCRIEAAKSLLKIVPEIPLSFSPNREQHLSVQLMVFNVGVIRSVDELFDTVGLLWVGGRFLGSSMFIRLALEYWGGACFWQEDH